MNLHQSPEQDRGSIEMSVSQTSLLPEHGSGRFPWKFLLESVGLISGAAVGALPAVLAFSLIPSHTPQLVQFALFSAGCLSETIGMIAGGNITHNLLQRRNI